jgi:hypothetical protein
MNLKNDSNFQSFLEFVESAKRNLEKQNISALKVDLLQARGRIENLLKVMENEES